MGEHPEAPDRIRVFKNIEGELTAIPVAPRKPVGPRNAPYVLETPARLAAEQMLEALKTAKQAMESAILSSGPDEGPRHGFDPNHPAMRQITAAIAAAEPPARG